jgi:hypothetical protein
MVVPPCNDPLIIIALYALTAFRPAMTHSSSIHHHSPYNVVLQDGVLSGYTSADIVVRGVKAPSKVSDQPLGHEETIAGATNRLDAAVATVVGEEAAGLIHDAGHVALAMAMALVEQPASADVVAGADGGHAAAAAAAYGSENPPNPSNASPSSSSPSPRKVIFVSIENGIVEHELGGTIRYFDLAYVPPPHTHTWVHGFSQRESTVVRLHRGGFRRRLAYSFANHLLHTSLYSTAHSLFFCAAHTKFTTTVSSLPQVGACEAGCIRANHSDTLGGHRVSS